MGKKKSKRVVVRRKAEPGGTTAPRVSLMLFKAVVLPDVMPLKMKYTDFRQYTCAANVVERIFRLNSIFDPDATLGGGLATGYTEWANLYLNYRVMAAHYKVSMTGSGNGSNGLLVCVANTQAAALATSSQAVIECVGTRKFSHGVQNGAGGPVVNLTKLVRMGELFGVSETSILTDNNYQQAFGNNPAFQAYLHVMINDQANATGVLDVLTEITFFVRLENPVSATVETLAALQRRNLELLESRIALWKTPGVEGGRAGPQGPSTRPLLLQYPTTVGNPVNLGLASGAGTHGGRQG